MKLAIMQPTFLPWPAYFGLIDYVDEFIFLDNVQFDKRSWQQRNYIISNEKKNLLTVPVLTKNKLNQSINEVRIDKSSKYINKHLTSIKMSYSKTDFYKKNIDEFSDIYNKNYNLLIDLNYNLIQFFLKKMNIKTKLLYASDLNINEKKESLINTICMNRKCSEYISPEGSKVYLNKLDKDKMNYQTKFYNFEYSNYTQKSIKFIKGASIVDVFFNLGDESYPYVAKNFIVKT